MVAGIALFLAQVILWTVSGGWTAVRTGAVLDPLLRVSGFDGVLSSYSMRGAAAVVGWIFATHLYLACLVSGIFLTSMDGRRHD